MRSELTISEYLCLCSTIALRHHCAEILRAEINPHIKGAKYVYEDEADSIADVADNISECQLNQGCILSMSA